MRYTPHKYQDYAKKHILEHPASGLFLDMGLGKTVTTLTAAAELLFLGDVQKVLVIAPLRVAEDTWSTEIDKWDHLKHLRISKILGDRKRRLKALAEDADIYVTNRENVDWLVEECFSAWPFDMVVIDELSSFKSSKAKRFRSLRKVRPYFKRIVGLTGTPAPNSLIDLWPQIYLLDGGKRLGRTMTGYKQQFFSAGFGSGHIVYKWNLKDGSQDAIYKRIGDICVSMKAKDYLELPDRMDNEVSIILPDKAKSTYRHLERDFVIDMGTDAITAANAAVLTNKLLQLSNGAIYTENHEVQEIHQEKLKALQEIIDTANGQPVLVFYSYKHDASRIKEYLKGVDAKELGGSEDIKAWNSGKIPVLLAHPASAGHGLNLQAGGHIIVWFGLTYSLEQYMQANARLHRQGQQQAVIIHHLIAKGTMDEAVMKVLSGKEANQDKLLEAVKAKIKNLREELND